MRRINKKWILFPAIAVILIAIAVIVGRSSAWSAFTPEEPCVTGDAAYMTDTVVTDVGSNLQGTTGSGATPCDEIVPTCEGEKGTEDNPFVVLEIVADKAQQQMTYLGQDDDGDSPLDVMKMGIDVSDSQGKSYTPGSSSPMDNDKASSLGQWFSNYQYEVKSIGGDGETETMTYAEIAKLYSLTITDADLEDANIDPDEFNVAFNTGTSNIYSQKKYDIATLSNTYPSLFKTDDDGKKIRDIAKEDKKDWNCSFETKVTKEEESETYKGSGYILAVEPGKGDFGFASQDDCNNWVFTKTGTDADRWVYVEDIEDLPEESVTNYKNDVARIYASGFYDNNQSIGWTGNSELYNTYNTSSAITGLYMDLSEYSNGITVTYLISEQETEDTYTFSYYGLRNNNVLKRQLFLFESEEECDAFNMEVICVTPSELNKLAKKDTETTADLIERADMFYIGAYTSSTYGLDNVYETYYHYVKGDTSYSYNADQDEIASFMDDDLEWELCYKIIYRLCNNANLPMIMTSALGDQSTYATEQIPMYKTSTYTNVSYYSTLNNMAKLYIIGTQFDLTAKKSDTTTTYYRTFYDDILGKLEEITLSSSAKSSDTSASLTGYYERYKLATTDAVDDNGTPENEKCYYWWNQITFFPEELEAYWDNGDQIKVDTDAFVSYGYAASYFNADTSNKLFTDWRQTTTVAGSDGTIGNVAIPHNGANGISYSTLLSNTDSGGVLNNVIHTAFLIMNNQGASVNDQSVTVVKQKNEYIKMSDTDVLLNYSSDDEYTASDTSYVKVKIHANGNTENGVVKSVKLENSSTGATMTVKMYKDKACSEECDEFTAASSPTGYDIPSTGTLYAYIPFSLADWADGYDTIVVKTVGRTYSQKREKIVKGTAVTTDISIGERELFNLE